MNTTAADTLREGGWSGSVSLGYDSKYVSRGLVLDHSVSDNIGDLELKLQYALSDKDALCFGGRYRAFSDNGASHYDVPNTESLQAYLRDWYHLNEGGYREYELDNPLCDEATARVQWLHFFTPASSVAFGYEFVHGGLPGRIHCTDYDARLKALENGLMQHNANLALENPARHPAFTSERPEEHSLVADTHHEFSGRLEGFFWTSRVRYTMQWESGWWLTQTLGYRCSLGQRAQLVLSATWDASINYFDTESANSNGTQGYTLSAQLPLQLSEHVVLTPYLRGVFAGNGARHAENKLQGRTLHYHDEDQDLDYTLKVGHYLNYEDVSLSAGLSLSYLF